jgi:hypothetical protein
MTDYFVGLDLAQSQDYSALAIAERTPIGALARYHVRHIERIPKGTRYPAIVDHTATMITRLRARHALGIAPNIWLSIDKTGVGAAVADLFRAEHDLKAKLLAVTITAGDATAIDGDEARVPKRDLASVVQVLLSSGRLLVSPKLAFAETLKEELGNFRVKTNLAGHDSYGAGDDWREGVHDDLVLALALAVWRGEWDRSHTGGAYSYSYIGGDDPNAGFDEERLPFDRMGA